VFKKLRKIPVLNILSLGLAYAFGRQSGAMQVPSQPAFERRVQ
jgi:hypothetical protein